MREKPLFLLDGAHNAHGMRAAAESLRALLPKEKVTLVLGILADKDVEGFLDIIAPCAAAFVCVTVDNPRALKAEKLAEKLKKYKKTCLIAPGVAEGMAMAKGAAGKSGVVCATGSLYMMGPVRESCGLG